MIIIMIRYIIKLDDASEIMNVSAWERIEELLDNYNIKPIVGIIPNNKDTLLNKMFKNQEDAKFWDKARKWQDKEWIIAQHGFTHVYRDDEGVHSEFSELSVEKQKEILQDGYNILSRHGIRSNCFFAPGHAFDDNTIQACVELKHYDFISDGYSFYPYKQNGMLFIPSLFDTPHKILPFGIYTFVFHPNFMTPGDFEYLDKFIKENIVYFKPVNEILTEINPNRKKSIYDHALYKMISLIRMIQSK